MPGTGPALTSMKELLGGLAIAIAVSFPAPLFFPAAEPIRPVSDWTAAGGGTAAMRSARRVRRRH